MKRHLLLALAALTATATFAKAPPRPKHPATPPEVRARLIDPVAAGALRLVPTFTSIGVTYGAEAEIPGLELQYRRAEPSGFAARLFGRTDDWHAMEFGCAWFPDVKNYRGSVFVLEEDTVYAVRLVANGRTLVEGHARTWKSAVPIARTVTIDPATATYPIVVSDRGSEAGWIRYVAKGPLVAPREADSVFSVTNAAYVVFDGLTLRGADLAAVDITDSRFVRFRKCDIADWGADGFEPRLDNKGMLSKGWKLKRGRFDYARQSSSSGIRIGPGACGVVVERSYIHEPHSRAHSWRYSHPYGPMAVRLSDSAGGHVLRWNDFVGCDAHRFDDTVGGGNDFYELGTFNRDSDIYGNFIAFANDDCLEIDGGQQNVRVFGNRFEAGYMGVSIQGAVVSPSYVFDNVFTGCGDEFGAPSASVKTSGIDLFDYHPFCAVFDNVMWGEGAAMTLKQIPARLSVRRNRCYGPKQRMGGPLRADGTVEGSPLVEVTGNATNLVSAACPAAGDWPHRPIPYALDVARIDGVKVARGVVSPSSARVTLTCGGKGYREPFRVQMNDATGWVRVSPAKGVVRSGEKIVFNVAFDAAKMAGVRNRRAAFRIATADGFSRPVTVYAETDFEQPLKCERPGETAVYAKVDPKDPFKTYAFDVPKSGRYWLLMRVKRNAQTGTGRGRLGNRTGDYVMGGMDGEAPDRVSLHEPYPWSFWMVVTTGGSYMSWCQHYDLKAGRHTFAIAPGKGGMDIEGLVLTDSPVSFEPELNKYDPPRRLKTPETSKLFEKFTDPVSGVVSYLLKPGLVAQNQQSLYYTQKAMTDDGRFLVFVVSPDESKRKYFLDQHLAVIDFLTDEITVLDDFRGGTTTPYLDVKTDEIFYMDRYAKDRGLFKRDLVANMRRPIKICDMPDSIVKLGESIGSIYTHLTRMGDGKGFFLGPQVSVSKKEKTRLSVHGVLDMETGAFTEWHRSEYAVRHGAANPVRPDTALALEPYWETHKQVHDCKKDGVCRRLLLLRPGKSELIVGQVPPGGRPPVHVVHTEWTADGTGIYWCSYDNGIILHNIDTGREEVLMKDNVAVHCEMSDDNRYIVFDQSAGDGGGFRGNSWKVGFYDRKTGKTSWIYTKSPALATAEKPSTLHPDPHPNFAMGDRYTICTMTVKKGQISVLVTPTAQFKK